MGGRAQASAATATPWVSSAAAAEQSADHRASPVAAQRIDPGCERRDREGQPESVGSAAPRPEMQRRARGEHRQRSGEEARSAPRSPARDGSGKGDDDQRRRGRVAQEPGAPRIEATQCHGERGEGGLANGVRVEGVDRPEGPKTLGMPVSVRENPRDRRVHGAVDAGRHEARGTKDREEGRGRRPDQDARRVERPARHPQATAERGDTDRERDRLPGNRDEAQPPEQHHPGRGSEQRDLHRARRQWTEKHAGAEQDEEEREPAHAVNLSQRH